MYNHNPITHHPYKHHTQYPTEKAWREARKAHGGLSASRISAILPGYQYTFRGEPSPTPFEVWCEVTGRTEPFAGNQATRAGTFFEGPNIAYFQETSGISCWQTPNVGCVRPDIPWLWASPDGYAVWPDKACQTWQDTVRVGDQDLPEGGSAGLLEAKNVSASQLSKWQSAPPQHYFAQVQAQLLVTEMPWAILMAKIDSYKLVAHLIYPDLVVQHYIKTRGEQFMRMIKEDEYNEDY